MATHGPVRSVFADDPDFQDILNEFLGALEEKQEVLSAAMAANDIESLRVNSHQLKGSGGGYGFDGLSQLASELEQSCKVGDQTAINARVGELLDYIARIQL